VNSKYLIIIFLSGLAACGQQRGEVKALTSKADSITMLLQGAWFGEEYDEHAAFYIKDDSINYIEHFEKYKYFISNDTLDILTNPNTFKVDFIISKLTKDSLTLKDMRFSEAQKKKYWKQK